MKKLALECGTNNAYCKKNLPLYNAYTVIAYYRPVIYEKGIFDVNVTALDGAFPDNGVSSAYIGLSHYYWYVKGTKLP